MSFSFSFSGDDIEDEIDANQKSTTSISKFVATPDALTKQFENTCLTTALLPPKRHTLADLLNSLPSQISYNYVDVPVQKTDQSFHSQSTNGNDHEYRSIRIPRRSLFDIRQQLMAESDPSSTDDETGNLLAGLETGDLRTGIYEGGFKTWECAIDLAGFVAGHAESDGSAQDGWHVVELGAGSAVPSLALLQGLLKQRMGNQHDESTNGERRVTFTLCDYNEDVLRLATAVNVYLAATLAMDDTEDGEEEDEEGDIEIDPESIQNVLTLLANNNIEVEFISGAWGPDFVQLASRNKEERSRRMLVLASETIYSPDSLHVFSQTVLDLLQSTQSARRAYIAAKKVYFGVGGGVQEFEEVLKKLHGISRTVLDVKSAGVGRVVLEVAAEQ